MTEINIKNLDLNVLLKPPFNFEKSSNVTRKIVFVDTETTGLDPCHDEITALCLVECQYEVTSYRLTSIDRVTLQYNEPYNNKISPKITALTGITADLVRGHKLDLEEIANALNGATYGIAHNAAFDSAFLAKYYPPARTLPWKCTLRNIDWSKFIRPLCSRSLSSLCAQSGFTFTAHRADCDALALVYLMYRNPQAFMSLLK